MLYDSMIGAASNQVQQGGGEINSHCKIAQLQQARKSRLGLLYIFIINGIIKT
jgi:hypothetical protein